MMLHSQLMVLLHSQDSLAAADRTDWKSGNGSESAAETGTVGGHTAGNNRRRFAAEVECTAVGSGYTAAEQRDTVVDTVAGSENAAVDTAAELGGTAAVAVAEIELEEPFGFRNTVVADTNEAELALGLAADVEELKPGDTGHCENIADTEAAGATAESPENAEAAALAVDNGADGLADSAGTTGLPWSMKGFYFS